MWNQIERELAQLLSKKVFPDLLPVISYRALLKPNGQPDSTACAKAAQSIVSTAKGGIREFGSGGVPVVKEWSGLICRAVSAKNNPYGQWWFDESLVQRWSRQYPPGSPGRSQNIMESLRPMLAVCNDWNDFTELRVMRPASPIPTIVGQGAHMPIYSKTDARHAANANILFIGGFAQVFVPFVNPARVAAYPLA